VLFGIVHFFLAIYNGRVDLKHFYFGNSVLLYVFNSVVGSLFIIFLTKLLDSVKVEFLSYCGKNSLIIMAVHLEVMSLISTVLERFMPLSVLLCVIRISMAFIVTVLLIKPIKKFIPVLDKSN
jgi:fucose 4-O-acetylase-like acetyltransferase